MFIDLWLRVSETIAFKNCTYLTFILIIFYLDESEYSQHNPCLK